MKDPLADLSMQHKRPHGFRDFAIDITIVWLFGLLLGYFFL